MSLSERTTPSSYTSFGIILERAHDIEKAIPYWTKALESHGETLLNL